VPQLGNLRAESRSVVALEATRRLVPMLYQLEHHVDSKLVEVPCEEALQFYVTKGLVFGRVYGHVAGLVFRLEEVSGRPHVETALRAAFHATLSACSDIHAYHIEAAGGEGPTFDCYLAEASPEDPQLAVEYACASERGLLADLQGVPGGDVLPIAEWVPLAVDELKRQDVRIDTWIRAQPGLPVPYPFRRQVPA